MSGWNGSMLGLKVHKQDEKLAAQFLKCIGADPDEEGIDEEIGVLDYAAFRPSVTGTLSEEEDLLGIEKSTRKMYSYYQRVIRNRYEESLYEDEEEDDEDEDEYEETEADTDSRLDDLSLLVSRLFDRSCVYFSHEDGNTVNDTFYRYETSIDPSKGKKTVSNCLYSFDGGPDRDHGTGDWVKPIKAKPFSNKVMHELIGKAESMGYVDLAGKIKKVSEA